MSNRVILTLKYLCGSLFGVYLALIVSTVLFATLQTKLASDIHATQIAIGTIEGKYYSEVSRLNSIDPHTQGYVKPTQVQYVASVVKPGLSYASR